MEYISVNIFVRQCDSPMRAGEVVTGHLHTFDHTTFCRSGALQIEVLEPAGQGLTFEEAAATVGSRKFVLKSDAPINWMLIVAGRYHRITSLEDGSIYQCIYSHRVPQAALVQPYTRVDDQGRTWFLLNDEITQDSQSWARDYR